jgi:hypothetical protein
MECPGQGDCCKSRDCRAENPRRDTFKDDALGYQPPTDKADNPVAASPQRNQGDKGSYPGIYWLESILLFPIHAIASH